MKVKVEACWGGGDVYHRVNVNGDRFRVNRDTWDRKAATEALDVLENVYHLPRSSIRFEVN